MSPNNYVVQDYEPRTFSEYIGQQHIIRELKALLSVDSTKSILLRGNYGLGKTTLAKIYASYRGDWTYQPIPKIYDKLNTKASTHVIDEVHLVSDFEKLYNEMDNHTFVFCTTEVENLPDPFVSRCIEFVLSSYSEDDLSKIIKQYKNRKRISVEEDGIKVIASRSKGTPRTALQLLNRVYALGHLENFKLTSENIKDALDSIKIFDGGMMEDDIKYLTLLNESKQPISLNTLSATLLRSKHYISSSLEPYLMNMGLMIVTPRGRIITERGTRFIERYKETPDDK